MNNIKYFDGHNDTLLKLFFSKEINKSKDFFNGNKYCHIDYPKIKVSNFIGGFFAIFTPDKEPDESFFSRMDSPPYDLELPDPINYEHAISCTLSMISILNKLIDNSKGKIILCKNSHDMRTILKEDKIGIILHIEGAEAISKNFDSLDILYNLGLRSIGLVWSRPNIFANGVPFSFPKDPDTGPGLTELGKELVKKCDEKNIFIDLSHLNEKGFWDVEKLSTRPLIATHSNVHELSNHSRNLTNKQLRAIKETGGIVGLNFATAFLRSDGQMNPDTNLELLVKHFDHLISFLGEDGVAIGSDFDGAIVPNKIKDLAGINELKKTMIKCGYNLPLVEKIFYKNWINFLEKNF